MFGGFTSVGCLMSLTSMMSFGKRGATTWGGFMISIGKRGATTWGRFMISFGNRAAITWGCLIMLWGWAGTYLGTFLVSGALMSVCTGTATGACPEAIIQQNCRGLGPWAWPAQLNCGPDHWIHVNPFFQLSFSFFQQKQTSAKQTCCLLPILNFKHI